MSAIPAAATTQPLVSRIVGSYVKKNHVPSADLPIVISTVYKSLIALGRVAEPAPTIAPAVSVRQSVRPGYVVCLECGARARMVRKHLRQRHGLSPPQYRAKRSLSPDHQSQLQLTPRSDPLTENRSAWDGKSYVVELGATQKNRLTRRPAFSAGVLPGSKGALLSAHFEIGCFRYFRVRLGSSISGRS